MTLMRSFTLHGGNHIIAADALIRTAAGGKVKILSLGTGHAFTVVAAVGIAVQTNRIFRRRLLFHTEDRFIQIGNNFVVPHDHNHLLWAKNDGGDPIGIAINIEKAHRFR